MKIYKPTLYKSGTRISKYVTGGTAVATFKETEYIGGYVIENDILSYYSMAEGRVRNEGGGNGLSLKMEYFITDQQGNTRVSFEDDGTGTNHATLIQENSYYAFGMQMAGGYAPTTNANKKLYNAGSEWQDDIDGLADYYSTFFREYDPIIGRFNGVDPMAEATDASTTYAYANNNPVMMNDPMGDYAAGKQTEQWIRDMQSEYNSWHDGSYGSNFFDRGWDLGGGGNDGEGGSGGAGGTYYSGFGNGDNYFGNNSTSNRQFWQSMLDLGKSLGQDNLHITRGEDGEFGYWENYSNYGSKGKKVIVGTRWVQIYFGSADAAAVYWARHKPNTAYEYSSIIYSVRSFKGKKYYTYSEPVRFPANMDARMLSPGSESSLHILPEGATKVGIIHLHLDNQADPLFNKGNENFSPKGDIPAMNLDHLDWYLVSPTDVLKVWRDDDGNPKILGTTQDGKFTIDPVFYQNYRGKRKEETWNYYFTPR